MTVEPSPVNCIGCGRRVAVRRGDGVIVVRWKRRKVEFSAGTVTCENCGMANTLDRLSEAMLA